MLWPYWLSILSIFLVWSLIACTINHIDDTDETYGYWEPLHYLLYGNGLQTWEYAPQYSIRTYSFIYPFYFLSELIKDMTTNKMKVFLFVRVVLSFLSSYSATYYIVAIRQIYGWKLSILTFLFILLSPGLFFCATSYLPSAVATSLLMISSASWLRRRFTASIMWGSIAVLCTGWPFVGLLLLPVGVEMIIDTFSTEGRSTSFSTSNGLFGVFQLIVAGLIIVVVVELPVLFIDYKYYNKW